VAVMDRPCIFGFRARRAVLRLIPLLLALVAMLAAAAPLGADIHSNGVGGGRWSQPTTWRGGKVPGPDDVVIIAARDVVAFDRNDEDAISCAELGIDPAGVLTFASGDRPYTLSVGGPIESYGAIRVDATTHPLATRTIRLAAADPQARVLRMYDRASLLLYGAPLAADSLPNVRITAPEAEGSPAPGRIHAVKGTMLDLQRVGIHNVELHAREVDNTGYQPSERLNLVGNRFTGRSQITLHQCDTPLIAENVFHNDGAPVEAAVRITASPLTRLQNNRIRGGYAHGFWGENQVNASIMGNVIEHCRAAIRWHGGDSMIRQNTVRHAAVAISATRISGAIEDLLAEDVNIAVHVNIGTLQLANIRTVRLAEDGAVIDLFNGRVTLVNCDVQPGQIRLGHQPSGDEPWVLAMHYLIVGFKGERPAGLQVDVATAGHDPELPDPNVRNNPAPVLRNGLTPLPQTLQPLIVRAWHIGRDGKPVNAPDYLITVRQRDSEKPLANMTVQPQPSWYRPQPGDAKPTVEVTLP
jgi:hypothetical protein